MSTSGKEPAATRGRFGPVMKGAKWILRVGAIAVVVGLFLLLTPLSEVALFLVIPFAVTTSLVGLCVIGTRPSSVALVGGIAVLLGLAFTAYVAWILAPIPCGPAGGGCLTAAPLFSQPAFQVGVYVVSLGIALVVVASIQRRLARRGGADDIHPASGALN